MGKTNLGRVTFVPRGTYSNETSYKRLDVVESEGSSYLFLKDSTGITPTGDGEVTMLLANKGKDFIYDDFTPEQLAALKGEKGDKGDPGKGLTILGYYGTLDLLKAAITTPGPGDAYGIGTAAPYDIYVFDGVTNDWVNNGKLSGGGEGGGNSVVFIPSAVLNLTNESPSAEILTAFGGKDAFISIVTQLEKGILPMINIEGVFFQFSLFAAYHDAENNTYTLGFRLADAEVLKINGYEGTNGLVAIVLTNDTASVEIMDIPGNGLNYIAIPGNVLNIDEGSTSEQIIAKFGGMDNIRSIIRNSESGGNSLYVLTADNARVPIMGTLYNFNGDYDSPSFEITLDILYLITKRVLTLRFNKGVAAVEYRYEGSLIADSELVSDPSVGGIGRPASAEAVKVVNDKTYISQRFHDIAMDDKGVVLLFEPANFINKHIVINGWFSGYDGGGGFYTQNIKVDLPIFITESYSELIVIISGLGRYDTVNRPSICECMYQGKKWVALKVNSQAGEDINTFCGNSNIKLSLKTVIYENYSGIANQEVNDSIIDNFTGFIK